MSSVSLSDKCALSFRNFMSGKFHERFTLYKNLDNFCAIDNDFFILHDYKLNLELVDYSNKFYRKIKCNLHQNIFHGKYDVEKFIYKFSNNKELKDGYSLFYSIEDLNTKEVSYIGSVDFINYNGRYLLTNFGLIDEFRGKGLSSYYLYLSLNYVKVLGVNSVFLYVMKDNSIALKLYRSFGFCRLNEVQS